MTKQWDQYEQTIKGLYAEYTLAEVRKVMSEKYNFNASTRAYRGRLIKWNVRKYNCRKQEGSGTSGSISGTSISPSRWSNTDSYKYPDTSISSLSSGSYGHRDVNNYQNYPEKVTIFPQWAGPATQSTGPVPVFDHSHAKSAPNVSQPMTVSSPISPTSYGYSSAPNTPSSASTYYTTIQYAPAANQCSSQQPPVAGYPPAMFPMDGTPQSDRDRRSSAPQMPTTTHLHRHQYGVGTYDGYPPVAAPYHGTIAATRPTSTGDGMYSPPQEPCSPNHNFGYQSPSTQGAATPTPEYQRMLHHHHQRHRSKAEGMERKKRSI